VTGASFVTGAFDFAVPSPNPSPLEPLSVPFAAALPCSLQHRSVVQPGKGQKPRFWANIATSAGGVGPGGMGLYGRGGGRNCGLLFQKRHIFQVPPPVMESLWAGGGWAENGPGVGIPGYKGYGACSLAAAPWLWQKTG